MRGVLLEFLRLQSMPLRRDPLPLHKDRLLFQRLLSAPQRSPSPSVLLGLHSPQRLPSPAGRQGLLQSPQRPRSPAVLRRQVLENNRRCTTRKELEERRPPARKTGAAATLQNASNAAEKYYQVNKNFIFILNIICYI